MLTTCAVLGNTDERKENDIVFRATLGDKYIYYVSKKLYSNSSHLTGYFHAVALSDSTFQTVADIESASITAIEIDDAGGYLHPSQIELKDIDAGCEGNGAPEILVRLYGPSDDPELIILGLNLDGEFVKLFHEPGQFLSMNKVGEARLEIVMNMRLELAGTSYFPQSFLYDTIRRDVYRVPDVIVRKSEFFNGYNVGQWPIRSKKPVTLYFDPRSAVRREKRAEIDELVPGQAVKIDEFYRVEGGCAAKVVSQRQTGWIHQDDLNRENFRLPAAD